MKIEHLQLIKELRVLTQTALSTVQGFKELSLKDLNYKPCDSSWSILECIEHLNLYGNFYLPEIEKQILNAKTTLNERYFKSGVLGNYFVNVIKATNPKKIKTTKQMDSTGSPLNFSTIDQFIKQLERLESLLKESEKIDISKIKTAISLSKLLKIRLGDTFRFLVYHNERHIIQATRMEIKASANKI